MANTSIIESGKLPSKGLIYDVEVNPDIQISSMTTNDEMKRLSPSEVPYKNICEIIDSCIVNDVGISVYDMCIGDYQYLLYKLRSVTYGPTYKIVSTCPFCGFQEQADINLDELNIISTEEDLKKYFEFDLPKSGNHIKLRYQTPRIMDKSIEQAAEFKRKANNDLPDQTIVFTIQNLIEEIDGKKPDPIKITDWIRNLPMMDTTTILTYSDKINESIGVDTSIMNKCMVCGLEYKTALKMTSEFFRPTINI